MMQGAHYWGYSEECTEFQGQNFCKDVGVKKAMSYKLRTSSDFIRSHSLLSSEGRGNETFYTSFAVM